MPSIQLCQVKFYIIIVVSIRKIGYNKAMRTETEQIISDFMQLIETIANTKSKILDFGDGMVFYRGEIHLIKIIGDRPGVFPAEVARWIQVTRAVITKTILKLERSGYVLKATDPADKKRVQLYLTERGQKAFKAHEQFHHQNDQHIYQYLAQLRPEDREVIAVFLQKARQMTLHHI